VKSLDLSFCRNLNGSGLGQLRSVTYLDVSEVKISNWQGLATLTSLTMLNAAGVNTGLPSLGESLATVSSLQNLELWQCYGVYSDDIIQIIAPVPHLVSLIICNNYISNAGVARIRQARPALRINW